jgi:hypothetical protein
MVCRNICEKNILQDNNGKNRYSLGNKYCRGYSIGMKEYGKKEI